MEFFQTTLGSEYNAILNEARAKYFKYEAILVTEEGEVPAMAITSMDWIRDYRNAAADEILMTLTIPWGKYLNRILPFKENLRITILKTTIGGAGSSTSDFTVEQTFNAFLQAEDEGDTMGTNPMTATEDVSDLSGLKTITVQLQEVAFTILRTKMVGGAFVDTRPFDVLMSLLSGASFNLDVEKVDAVTGINAVDPNNTSTRSNIMIPHGLPLVSLADKLQTQYGGIYNSGIGCYYQKGAWWVWPLYNMKMYDEVKETALFILPPTRRLGGVEHTWKKVDGHLTVIVTGGVSRSDPSELLLLNEGNATRYVNPDNLLEGFFEVGQNKAVAKRSSNSSEYEAISRRSGSMSRVNADMTHSNNYHEASKLVARNGAYITMEWENSDPDVLIPGLQCEVGFFHEGRAVFINGVLVHAHSYSALSGMGLHQTVHQVTTEVVVMVDRNSPVYSNFLNRS